jgi:hypothetical protein
MQALDKNLETTPATETNAQTATPVGDAKATPAAPAETKKQ